MALTQLESLEKQLVAANSQKEAMQNLYEVQIDAIEKRISLITAKIVETKETSGKK